MTPDVPVDITVTIDDTEYTYRRDVVDESEDEGEGPSNVIESRFADRSSMWLRLTDDGEGVSYVPIDDTKVESHDGKLHNLKAVTDGPYVRRGTYDEHDATSGWYFNESETVTAIDAANAVERDNIGGGVY